MDHGTYQDLIPAYAVGATDPDESKELAAHLVDCAECRALLAEYETMQDHLLWSVPLIAAPPDLAARLRKSVQARPPARQLQRRWSGLRMPALAGIAIALVLLVAGNVYWYSRAATSERQVTAQATAIASLAEAPTVELSGDNSAPNARGVLYFHPASNVAVLHTYDLPALPPDKAYQVWLIYGDQRDSGGLFRIDDEGEGILLITAPHQFDQYQRLGITIEPRTGSRAPTTPRVMGGTL